MTVADVWTETRQPPAQCKTKLPKYHVFLTEVLSNGSNKRQTCVKKYLVMNSLRYQITNKTEHKNTQNKTKKNKPETHNNNIRKTYHIYFISEV